jgi:preprotein translocase subunit SecF
MFLLRDYFPENINVDFLKFKYWGYFISLFISIVSIYGLFTKGLNFGIDFKGGILIEIRITKNIDLKDVRSELNHLGIGDISIQTAGSSHDILIKAGGGKNTDLMKSADLIKKTIIERIDPNTEFRKVEYVGAEVGDEMVFDGLLAVILTFIGIMIYIWFRFNWQYSLGMVAGLFHDLIMTMGFIVYTGYEFNITSIAAILTIIGYSVNDGVVVYDRIRENLYKIRKKSFVDILNLSVNETLYRNILTLSTTLIAASALILFGGEALRSFSVTVFVGIVAGAYSSLFVSIPFLLFFEKSFTKRMQ